MNLERIADSNAFEFRFDPSSLDRLASIYEGVVAPQLDFQTLHNNGFTAICTVKACISRLRHTAAYWLGCRLLT